MMKLFCLSAVVMMILTTTAKGGQAPEITEADYAKVNAFLIDGHVVPRYETLVQVTTEFAATIQSFCRESDNTQLPTLHDAFQDVMDAWFGIAHIHFGPIEFLMRQHRFYFWPQARKKIVVAVDSMVNSGNVDDIANSSVAVQGLLAAEVLLFHERFLGSGEANKPQICIMLSALGQNIKTMAMGTLSEWQDGEAAYAEFMKHPHSSNPFYESHAAVTLNFFQSLYNRLQFVHDINLKPVAGNSIDKASPAMAESRFSSRSTQNLVITVRALQELYGTEGNTGLGDLAAITDIKLHSLMNKAFSKTLETAEKLDFPIEVAAIDPEKRPQLEQLTKQVQAIKQIIKNRLSRALGMTVGFNALDGD